MKRSLVLLVLISLSSATYANESTKKNDAHLERVLMGTCLPAYLVYHFEDAYVPEKVDKAGYKKLFQVGLFTGIMAAKWLFAYPEVTKKEIRELVKKLLPA